MKSYHYKKRSFFSGSSLLGLLFMAVGLFSFIRFYLLATEENGNSLYTAIAFISFGIIITSVYSGTLIDFENKKMKTYSAFLGFKFGQWTELSDISHIHLISDTYQSINEPNGISPTLSGTVTDYTALLYDRNNQVVLNLVFTKEQKAIHDCQFLSSQLNAKLEFLVTG